MVRLLKFVVVVALALVIVVPAALIGFAWWDGSRLLGQAEKTGWLPPVSESPTLTPLESAAANAVFGRTWDVTGEPCRTGARFWLSYVSGPDKDGLSISQLLVRDISDATEPGLDLRAQLRQIGAACLLERKHNDTALLRMWLAQAPLGEGTTGAEAAAQAAFGKSADQLTPSESARLLALFYDPGLKDRPDAWSAVAQSIASRTAESALGVAPRRETAANAPAEPDLIPEPAAPE